MSKMSSSGGVGFFGVLFAVFLALKLAHVINWSWWWVTAPLWGPSCLCLAFALFCLVMYGAAKASKSRGTRSRP